jgi:hypothetical protein
MPVNFGIIRTGLHIKLVPGGTASKNQLCSFPVHAGPLVMRVKKTTRKKFRKSLKACNLFRSL